MQADPPGFVLALVLALIAVPAQAETLLYDGNLSSQPLPSDQGWLYGFHPIAGNLASQTASGGKVTLDTTSRSSDQAGYFSKLSPTGGLPQMPFLDRNAGYTLSFDLQVDAESHDSNDRAGFSLIAISQDLLGIEIGFWTDRVWDQSSAFTQRHHAAFDTTTRTTYELTVRGGSYALNVGDQTILSGTLQAYTLPSNSPLPLDPYQLPSFVFLGDDTSSAGRGGISGESRWRPCRSPRARCCS